MKTMIATSNTRSLLTIVVKDSRDRPAFGLMLESEKQGFFTAQAASELKGLEERRSRLAFTLAGGQGSARPRIASRTHQSIPFSSALLRLQSTSLAISENKGRRILRFWGILLGFFVLVGLIPWKQRAVGECSLLPTKRAVVVSAETTGRLTEAQRQGGTPRGRLISPWPSWIPCPWRQTSRLRTRNGCDSMPMCAHDASPAGDMPVYQVAWHQSRKASEQENKNAQQDIARAELRSPIAGIILTKDVDLRRGEVLPIGKDFCEVASLEDWNLQVDVEEGGFWRGAGCASKWAVDRGRIYPLRPVQHEAQSPDSFDRTVEPDGLREGHGKRLLRDGLGHPAPRGAPAPHPTRFLREGPHHHRQPSVVSSHQP